MNTIKIAILTMTITILGSWANAADVFYANDFESGIGDVAKHGGCYDYSFSTVTSPTRTGSHSLRVINKGNEDNMNCSGVWKTAKHRAQMNMGSHSFVTSAKYWMGWSIFVPNDISQAKGQVIISQNNAGPGGPEWALYLRDGKTFHFNTVHATKATREIPITKGKWMDFVLYYTRSWTGTGEMKIWVNGVVEYNVTKSNTAHNIPAGSAVKNSNGLYWGEDLRSGNYTIYFDSYKFAKGDNGYDLVAPGGKSTPTPAPALAKPKAPGNLKIMVQ